MQEQAKLVFYGVRGSYPVSQPRGFRYGGNTTCLLLEKGDKVVILDAGTGLIYIGPYLKKHKPNVKKLDIFLTHLHIDHILGLPFFDPVFDSSYEINFYCDNLEKQGIRFEDGVYAMFKQPLSPIEKEGIKAKINFIPLDVKNPTPMTLRRDFVIEYIKEYEHPLSGVIMYRMTINGKKVVFATDIESLNGFSPVYLDYIRGVDILIHDSHYLDSDYVKGYGHSTVSMAVANASKAKVKKLYLFHYNPEYTDDDVDRMLASARQGFKETHLSIELNKITL